MKSGRKTAAILLLFVGLVLFNYLASTIPYRLDVTEDKIYTLSDGTKSLLGKIEEPIVLDYYFNRNAKGLPVQYKNFAGRVEEMLHQYVRASHGKLTLNVINPEPDTPEEERATVAGIETQGTDAGDQFLFGVVATQADQTKTLPALSVDREQYLEFDVSQLIYAVQQVVKKKLGVITVMPLIAENSFQARLTGKDSPGQIVATEWQSTFDIVKVEPNATSLPPGLDVLAIVHPQGLHPKLQYSIDQFLLSGKPVFLAVDPSSYYFHRSVTGMQMLQGGNNNGTSDMPTLLSGWGVKFDADMVVGDPRNLTGLGGGNGGMVVQTPFIISFNKRENFNATAMATSNLRSLRLLEPGELSLAPGTNLTFTPLVETSDQAGSMPGEAFTDRSANIEMIARALKPTGKKTLAAFITGKFKSAFPNGEPPDPPLPDGSQPPPPATPPAPSAPAIKESTGSSSLIVIGDSDFLMDFASGQKTAFGFYPANDNITFAVNAVEFLGGSQDLISVRSKRASIKTFDVVRNMELDAQKQYGDKQKELESKLAEVRSRLSDLQGQTSESKMLVPTADVQKAIDDYRKEQISIQSQLRDIRRNLRVDIDSLENKLLTVNLLATPLLVLCFGIWFYRQRRRA